LDKIGIGNVANELEIRAHWEELVHVVWPHCTLHIYIDITKSITNIKSFILKIKNKKIKK
jgi:hypothetical protein